MPVATATEGVALSEDLGPRRRLAELLDVDPAQVTRWARGGGIDQRNAERVDLLELVMSQLLRLYEADAAASCLIGWNPSLHDRQPIELVRSGRTRELLDAIRNEAAGGF